MPGTNRPKSLAQFDPLYPKIISDYQNDACKVSIYDHDYKYETLDDFIENNGIKVKYLRISIEYNESIFGSEIIFQGLNVTMRAQKRLSLANEIFGYLKIKTSILYYLFNPWLWFTVVAVFFANLPPENILEIVEKNLTIGNFMDFLVAYLV